LNPKEAEQHRHALKAMVSTRWDAITFGVDKVDKTY